MATKSKTKKSNEPEKFASPLTGDYVVNVRSPEADPVDVQVKDDTDISKKIYDIIEHEYPRTRVGTDGYLHAILCELIRARLSK
ncbi:hypothetical protein [uncultured Fibrobacter sp.]|uniref:hypothetical protein n=1 Tax=uncultured Fibrobacter sp. TaxID=261512 RepID=UPI0025CBD51E|nr:hypothetical protein [uncultured Fibrobacter sp.]